MQPSGNQRHVKMDHKVNLHDCTKTTFMYINVYVECYFKNKITFKYLLIPFLSSVRYQGNKYNIIWSPEINVYSQICPSQRNASEERVWRETFEVSEDALMFLTNLHLSLVQMMQSHIDTKCVTCRRRNVGRAKWAYI